MRKEGKRERERESGQVDAEGVILLPLCFTVVVGKEGCGGFSDWVVVC